MACIAQGVWITVALEPIRIAESIKLGEDLELDLRAWELRRSGRVLKLERIPMELLLLLIQRREQLVSREEIVSQIWGKDVFLDADNSINAAIRKIRQAIKDDPERPRFIQTITGKGYRWIAPVIEQTPPLSSPDISPRTATDGLIGKKVSHYRVLEILGGGGMGVVYKAEDLRLGRRVALKFLPGELAADSMAFDRLQREARAASSLDHPNICTIYELDEHDHRPFIAMQLLEGQTLREWIGKAPERNAVNCVKELLNLSIQICAGLEAAHSKGIIHRDIKPANIFITNRGEARILDFGVAKILGKDTAQARNPSAGSSERGIAIQNGHATTTDVNLSQTGASPGTPSYLSPEQIRGEKLDARTDLFSFGLVLYEMATGQRAFPGDTVAVIRDAVLHVPAVPARQLQSWLPAELETIIDKAMEKDRNLRYQTATELRSDLERLSVAVNTAPARTAATDAKAPAVRSSRTWRVLVPTLVLLVAALSAIFYYRSFRANRLTEKDTIVVADFVNSTGDAVFDDTLKQGLGVALRQSPFLSILSDDKVTANLRLMTRQAGMPITADVAREVCLRSGSKAYIEGAIASLGSEYVVGLKAVNCRSGEVLAREQVTAPVKEKVIAALGEATTRLRGELGESLATVQKYDVRLEAATTGSLEALKAYSLGRAEAIAGAYLTAVPLYKRALELDPEFAMAYARLGQTYANSGQNGLAVESIRKAFELRERTSEPEKLYIETRYYELVSGDIDKRIEVLQLWKRMYPQESGPVNDLASEYSDMGKFEQALAEAREAVRLAPAWHTAYELLGISYLGLNRWDEARAVRQKETELKLDYHWDHIDLYGIAFTQNDAAGMQREIEWAKGNKYEFLMLRTIAGREASMGKLRKAGETYRQAMESAKRAGFSDSTAELEIDRTLMEAMAGNMAQAGDAAKLVPAGIKNLHALIAAGDLFTMIGDTKRANAVIDEAARRSPAGTYVKNVWVPTLRAEMEISRGNHATAVELLQSAAPYEFGWKAENRPNYVRGLAYLSAKRGQEAAAEFQKILDHSGVCLSGSLAPLTYTLSYLQLGRARAISGDAAGARAAYQNFLALWKDADPDIPVLQQAKAEFARLQ